LTSTAPDQDVGLRIAVAEAVVPDRVKRTAGL
jgi:hypothetical protein